MSIALILPDRDVTELTAALATLAPDINVQIWPDLSDPDSVRLAVVWYPPPGSMAGLNNLTAVLNFGAGVDGLVDNSEVPPKAEMGRILLDSLRRQMSAYCLAAALPRLRRLDFYRQCQTEQRWAPRPSAPATIGLLGHGYLGLHLGRILLDLGYPVIAWSRTAQQGCEGLTCVQGDDGLEQLLKNSACVICLLPLTPATQGLLNRDLFARMQPGSHLINVARGNHLVEADLLAGLSEGRPGAATLDVHQNEPLAADHPFWRHPAITITPHVASLTIPLEAAGAVVRSYRRVTSGHGVDHPVSRDAGY